MKVDTRSGIKYMAGLFTLVNSLWNFAEKSGHQTAEGVNIHYTAVMYFQTIAPSPLLRSVVERYWIAEASAAAQQTVELPVSAGVHHAIIYSCEAPHQVKYADGPLIHLPKCFLIGHLTRPAVNVITARSVLLGVSLKHTAVCHLWGIPADCITDTSVDIELALGTAGRELKEKLANATDHQQRIGIMEAFLLAALRKADLHSMYADHALGMLEGKAGNMHVKQLCQSLGISERHLNRHFTSKVGVTPKLYARILRFNQACNLLAHLPKAKVQDVIHHLGYYDQSHFIKDFVSFTGQNPSVYFSEYEDFNQYYFDE